MSKQNTIEEINAWIVKAIAKKTLDLASLDAMPFAVLTFAVTKSGYGFSMTKEGKDRILLSVRTKDGIKVHIRNEKIDYVQTYPISDITLDRIPTDSAVKAYKKYCVNTVYTIIQTWLDTADDQKPDLGEWNLYKY